MYTFGVSSAHVQLLAFFLNAYNLMVLHAHVVRGSLDGSDFKSQKIPFTRDNQYMIAAYNYSLGTPPTNHTHHTRNRAHTINAWWPPTTIRSVPSPITHPCPQAARERRTLTCIESERDAPQKLQ
jgi:hypothetical protein